jgi:hypothetical protein
MRSLHRVKSEESMESSIKRTIKSRQIGMVQTYHLISGTAATPADQGDDMHYVSSVQDLGVGSYKINFKGKALRDISVAGIASVTPGAILSIAAVDSGSITVAAKDDAGAALDADFYISCLHATTFKDKF